MPDLPITDNLYTPRRDAGGVYSICYENFSESEDSLAVLNHPADFAGDTERWEGGEDKFTTYFYRVVDDAPASVGPASTKPPSAPSTSANSSAAAPTPAKPSSAQSSTDPSSVGPPPAEPRTTQLTVILFGEVLGERDGTALGAMGDKRNVQKITLSTKARDKIALGVPTCATHELSTLFFDQIHTLTDVLEAPVPGPTEYAKSSWVRIKPAQSVRHPSVIIVTLPPKYASGEPSTKLRRRQSDMDVAEAKSAEVSLEAKYDPSRMPDYEARAFDLGRAHLVQQNMLGVDGELVPPWDAQSVFREGALIAVEANLLIYHFLEAGEKASHRYQIAANRIMLLDPSPTTYQPTKRPLRRHGSGSQSSSFNKLLSVGARKAGGSK